MPNEDNTRNQQQLLRQIRQIMTAINQIDGTYYLAAKKMGVNENELALLYAIGDGQPHSQKEVSEQWHLCLTDAGKAYCNELLKPVYAAETTALSQTLQSCSESFVEGFSTFSQLLEQQFQQSILAPPGKEETTHEN